jgi:hypothetical protein
MYKADIKTKLSWLSTVTSAEAKQKMPNYVGGTFPCSRTERKNATANAVREAVTWFEYDKEQDFRLWISGDQATNEASKAFLANGTSASGAKSS